MSPRSAEGNGWRFLVRDPEDREHFFPFVGTLGGEAHLIISSYPVPVYELVILDDLGTGDTLTTEKGFGVEVLGSPE